METLPEPARALLNRRFGGRWRDGSLTRIHGATNLVLKLKMGEERFAIRIPQLSDASFCVDRASEYAVLRTVHEADLGPEVIACDTHNGILITRWMQMPLWTPALTSSPSRIRAIANTLRKLHALSPPLQARTLDLEDNLRSYWETLMDRSPVLAGELASLHEKCNALLARRPVGASVLCHNDLNCRNILGGAEELRLLDWEYSGIGEALFDLASYAQNHDLDREARQLLLEAYGAPEAAERFAIECQLFDWTCVLWMALAGEAASGAGRPRFDTLMSRLTAGGPVRRIR